MFQYTEKRASGPKCPVTGKRIQGVIISRTHPFLLVYCCFRLALSSDFSGFLFLFLFFNHLLVALVFV